MSIPSNVVASFSPPLSIFATQIRTHNVVAIFSSPAPFSLFATQIRTHMLSSLPPAPTLLHTLASNVCRDLFF